MRKSAVVQPSLAIVLTLLLVFPVQVWPQVPGQHAGKVSALIPAVNLVRAGQSLTATPEIPVLWEDTVATGHLARARVALDDGSVLNVGADSSLRVTKHDAASQQTDLELGYGRVRANAVKQTKPGASFQIRTPTGVAGVVGTDFFLEFDNYVTRIIVFEGKVRFCNLAGVCVEVNQGQSSTIRGDQAPDAPGIAPNTDLMDAGRSTALKGANAGVAELAPRPEASPGMDYFSEQCWRSAWLCRWFSCARSARLPRAALGRSRPLPLRPPARSGLRHD